MRSPSLVLLFVAMAFGLGSHRVHADDAGASWNGYNQKYYCDSSNEDPTFSLMCSNYAHPMFDRVSQKYPIASPTKEQCQDLAKLAQACCGGDMAACRKDPQVGQDLNNAYNITEAAGTAQEVSGANGQQQASTIYTQISNNCMYVTAAQEAACTVTKEICSNRCGTVGATDQNSKNSQKTCQALNISQSIAQGKECSKDKDIGKQVQDKTGAGTPGGGAPGDTAKSTSPGSGGGMNPASLMSALGPLMNAMNQQQQPPTTPPTVAAVDCNNPAIVGGGCTPQAGAAASNSWNSAGGTPQSTNSSGTPNFNVGNPTDGAQPQPDFAPQSVAAPATSGTVSNGGGGMIGGGGGGMPGGGNNGSFSQSPGVNTDIMHGYNGGGGGGGGGYAAINAGMNMTPGGSGGFSSYGRNPAGDGLDLSQFLPGGAHDPTRRAPAGAFNPQSAQILSPGVNMWHRISDHIRMRCAQGLLRDCTP